MNLNSEDYKEPLRRIADELMNERPDAPTNQKLDKERLGRVQQNLDALEKCFKKAIRVVSKAEHLGARTVVLILFLSGAVTLVINEPKRWKAEAPNTLEFESKSPRVHPGPERSTDAEKTVRTQAEDSAQKLTNERPLVSKNLTSPSLESRSFTRTKRSQHPFVARTVYSIPPAVAEASSRQLLPRVTFPIGVPVTWRYDESGRLRPRELQPWEKVQAPSGYPMRVSEGGFTK